MTKRKIAALIAVGLMLPATGFAQRITGLEQGARVRVTSARKTTVGTVEAITRDSLTVMPGRSGVALTTSFDRLNRIDVSNGRSHLRGAGIGSLLGLTTGAAVGGLVGAAVYHGECDILVCSRGSSAGLAGLEGAIGGLVLGTLVGAATGIEKWETVDKRRFRPAQ